MGALRFILAMSVVASHAGAILGFTLLPGWMSVEVFFVISGFYMSLIMGGKYADAGMFYGNRFLRLYPTYLLTVAATWAWFMFTWVYLGREPTNDVLSALRAIPWWQSALIWFSNLTMFGVDIPSLFHYRPGVGFMFFHSANPGPAADGAMWAGHFRTVGQSWSLGLEIWFYLLVPMLARWRSLWLILLGLASLALKLSLPYSFGYFLFPAQLCLFILGMLLHRFYIARRVAEWPRRYGWAALIFCGAVILSYQWLPKGREVLLYAGVIPLTPLLFALTRNSAFDAAIGNLSYPIYMVHILVNTVIMNVFGGEHPNLVAVATILAAVALYLVVERPVDRFRHSRLQSKRPPIGQAQTA